MRYLVLCAVLVGCSANTPIKTDAVPRAEIAEAFRQRDQVLELIVDKLASLEAERASK